jgi:bifunctional enzyme CysN/CysC
MQADSAARAHSAGAHRAATVWLTGLSGAGKSTIATALVGALLADGIAAASLDGDVLRTGLNANLGFDAPGRAEAVRRAGEASLLLAAAGVVPVVALISPYRADRDRVRERHAAAGVRFIEAFVDAPIDVVAARDPKGLYARARAGLIPGFTGISDPYEPPVAAEVVLRTAEHGVDACVRELRAALLRADISR